MRADDLAVTSSPLSPNRSESLWAGQLNGALWPWRFVKRGDIRAIRWPVRRL